MAGSMSLAVIGCGVVGSEVIERLLDTSHCKEGRLKILAIANSRKMILGVNPSSWSQDLVGPKAADTDLEKICTHITSEGTAHTIIDCTCSEAIANMYGHWLLKDINVVTSNKKAFSGDPEYFKKLIAYQKSSKAALLFESTVCAGLPVLSTISDLVSSNDEILRLEGVLSGTISFIFNSLSPPSCSPCGDLGFSGVVKHAKEKGYTEPDPRDDLSGLDFARKVVILGRLAGYGTSLSDIKVENLCPEPLRNRNIPVPKFMEMLSGYDEAFGASLHSAHNDKCSIRYTFILGRDGVASVGIHAYPAHHHFSGLGGTENMIAITTSVFSTPIVIRGPGAGGPETSFGVISDVIKILKANNLVSVSPLGIINA